MGDVSKMLALKSMMGQQQVQQQEMQQRQQQLNDQKATTQAMKSIDPTQDKYKENPQQYYSDAAQSVLANGGSATAAQGLQQHGLTVQKTVSDIHAQDAATGSKNLETFIKKQGAVGDQLGEAKDIPDDQLQGWALQKVQDLTKNGLLDPQAAQHLVQGLQQATDPKALRDQIQVMANTSMGVKAVGENQQKVAEAQKDKSQAAEADEAANQKRMESQWYQNHGGAPGVPTEAIQQSDWLSKNPGKTPSDYVVWKAQHSPSVILQGGAGGGATGNPDIDMVGRGQMDYAAATARYSPLARKAFDKELAARYPDFNQATYSAEKGVLKDFTSGDAAKNLTAFNTAIEHAGQLSKAADALNNGDVRGLNAIGNTLGYQFGSDKTTNFNVIKNALSGEISKVFKGGQATDAEIYSVQAPFDAANSPEQLKGAISNAVSLMNSKRDALKEQYKAGSQGKPNFGNDAPKSAVPPQGATHTARGSDGHLHYTNSQGQDLGIVSQ